MTGPPDLVLVGYSDAELREVLDREKLLRRAALEWGRWDEAERRKRSAERIEAELEGRRGGSGTEIPA